MPTQTGEEAQEEEDAAAAGEEEGEPPYVQLHPPARAFPSPCAEGDRRNPPPPCSASRGSRARSGSWRSACRHKQGGDWFQDDYVLMPRLQVHHQQDFLW